MTRDAFEQRATTLEDEFFFRVDQQLMLDRQEEQRIELDEQALERATGIVDHHVLEELRKADVTPRTLVAFSLFPSVFVAWSDGHLESAERDAILKAARHQGIFSESPSWELLDSWLHRKPPGELIAAWKDFIHAIRPTISDLAFRQMRQAAMDRSREIAQAAGGFLGLCKVSRAESAAIAELNEVFDHAVESAEPDDDTERDTQSSPPSRTT